MLLDDIITQNIGSGMFGPQGAENLRTGHWSRRRDLGLGWILYGFVRATKPEVVVEIGSGGSTCCVAFALAHNMKGKVISIDINQEVTKVVHDALDLWNIGHYVKLVTADSADVEWNQMIDILVIDGSHNYEGTKIEWDRFSPFLKRGGYAFMHDVMVTPVGKLAEEIAKEDPSFSMIAEPDMFGLGILQKRYTVNPETRKKINKESKNADCLNNITDARNSGMLEAWKGSWFSI